MVSRLQRLTWAFAGALLAAALVAGSAGAQTATAKRTPATVPTPTQTADAAARAAAAGGGKPTKAEQDFLLEQALRAEKIRTDAQKQAGDIATLRQDEAVARQRAEQSAWVQEQQARAARISGTAIDEAERIAGINQDKTPRRPQYLVFVSHSMGEAGLKAAFEYGRGNPSVGFVFRGFLPGQSPKQFYDALVKYQGKTPEQMVLVMLDPPSYRDHAVAQVPAIVQFDGNEKFVAKVSGLINPNWLRDQIDDGKRGDLGRQGQTFAIAETDLLVQMKQRASELDLRKEAESAKDRFFREMPTIDLPYASETRVRRIVPQVVANQDVVDHEGRVRYRKGQAVSMTEHLGMAPVLVVFNSQDPYHVAFAKQIIQRTPANKKVILMTTRVDREGGIPNYARQEVAIGRPVYLLMSDVQQTFGIERVPTVVTPTDKEFVVVEVSLTQGAKGNGNAGPHSP